MNAPELAQIRGQHSDHRRDERDICMERCTMPRREDKEGVRAGGKCQRVENARQIDIR